MSEFRRVLRLAATLLLFATMPAVAQDSTGQPVADVFDRLTQLQDANLGIARQMSETERLAATELDSALAQGGIANPTHQAIAKTLIGNALTLASVMLSPIQTHQMAPGDSMVMLIQRNIAMLQSIAPYAAQDRTFSAAVARYTVLQMQTQDLASALQNGWNRYGDILRQAQASGILLDGAFDSGSQSWTLQTPNLTATATPPPKPTPTLAPTTTTTTVAAVEPPPAEPVAPAEDTQAPPAAAPSDAPVPAPSLTGNPKPAEDGTLAAAVTPLAVPQEADEPHPADEPERLAPGGPLDIAPPPPESGPVGDWLLTADDLGASVSAPNLNAETLPVIQGLTIRCGANRDIEYAINANSDFTGFRVYSDRSQYRTVRALQNVVAPDNTAAMTDTLKLAYDWAQQVPDAGRRLTIRADDASGTLALFSANGFLEARDKVAAACANPQPVPMAATAPAPAPVAETTVPVAETPAPVVPATETTTTDTPDEATPPAATAAPTGPNPPPRDPHPPIPAPRLERPIDIMGGG